MHFSGMNLRIGIRRLFAAAVAQSSLLDGLTHYWALDEVSGVRNDSIGTAHLTDNNTVGSVNVGPQGTSAEFIAANSEWLSAANASAVDLGTSSFTIAGWCYNGGAANGAIAGKGDALFGGAQFTLYIGSQTSLTFYVNSVNTPVLSFPVGTVGFVVAWFDAATGKCYCSLNNATASESVGTTTNPGVGIKKFGLGSYWGDSSVLALDGTLSDMGVWSRTLTPAERTSLFNSGNGKRYSDLTTAEKVGLVSYWNLDEVSGVRSDSHGTNHLTDNNTVGSVNSGPTGTVAQFLRANVESLSIAAPASAFAGASAYTITGWFRTSLSGTYIMLVNKDDVGANREYGLFLEPTGKLVYQTGGVTSTRGGLNDGQWHHFAFGRDGVSTKGFIQIDGAARQIAGGGMGTPTPVVAFYIGNRQDNIYAMTGSMSGVGYWASTLSEAGVTGLFNAGISKRYADLTTAEKVGLVSYWNLDEASGTRNDSHGTNHLTDNNTVGSVINSAGHPHNVGASFVRANSEFLSYAPGGWLSGFPTISCWFNLPVVVGFQYLLKGNDATTGVYTYIRDSSEGMLVLFGDGVGLHTLQTGTISPPFPAFGQWNHMLLWVDSATRKINLQINGGTIQVGSTTLAVGGVAAYNGASYIGINGSHFPNGFIDEVVIWNRNLTPAERTALYAAGAGVYYPSFT